MKKNQIILALVSIALLLGNPAILAQESEKKEQISKLKEQYNKFKDAFSCVRKHGWRGCDAEKKKKIKQAVRTLIVLVIVTYIGYRWYGWYQKHVSLKKFRKEQNLLLNRMNRTGWANSALVQVVSGKDPEYLQLIFDEKELEEFKKADVATQITMLLGAGADPNHRAERYEKTAHVIHVLKVPPPLHIAARNFDLDAIKALLAAPNIEVNTKDSSGNTPLDLLIFKFNDDHPIIEALRKKGAKTSAELARIELKEEWRKISAGKEKEKKADKEEL